MISAPNPSITYNQTRSLPLQPPSPSIDRTMMYEQEPAAPSLTKLYIPTAAMTVMTIVAGYGSRSEGREDDARDHVLGETETRPDREDPPTIPMYSIAIRIHWVHAVKETRHRDRWREIELVPMT